MGATLIDGTGRALGTVTVERREGSRVLGRFSPIDLPDDVRRVFERHEEVVEQQMFSFLDECEAAIEALGLQIRESPELPPYAVTDVQIMHGRISFERK
jgi:hypothetical protein